MLKFNKEIHKLSNSAVIGGIATPGCGNTLSISTSGDGVYNYTYDVGSDVGDVYLIYEAYNKPDRFEVIHDGVVVLDTKYVGADLEGSPPDTTPTLVGTYNDIPIFNWDGASFVDSGTTTNVTIGVGDIANGTTEKSGKAGTTSFNKGVASPTTVTIRVTSPRFNSGFKFYTFCISNTTKPMILGASGTSAGACNNYESLTDGVVPGLLDSDIYYMDIGTTLISTTKLTTDQDG